MTESENNAAIFYFLTKSYGSNVRLISTNCQSLDNVNHKFYHQTPVVRSIWRICVPNASGAVDQERDIQFAFYKNTKYVLAPSNEMLSRRFRQNECSQFYIDVQHTCHISRRRCNATACFGCRGGRDGNSYKQTDNNDYTTMTNRARITVTWNPTADGKKPCKRYFRLMTYEWLWSEQEESNTGPRPPCSWMIQCDPEIQSTVKSSLRRNSPGLDTSRWI